MLKNVLFIVLILGLALTLAFIMRPDQEARLVLGVTDNESAFTASLKPIYEKPSRLVIDSLRLDLNIIEVGVEEDGTMEAPKDWFSAGWYKRGARAGENGNLVLNAHYDTDTGRPAAFWELKNLRVGDTVWVIDDLGRSHAYLITEIFYLGINDPDRLKIFKSDKQKPTLTLITCGGIWLPGEYTYSQRLIVKGELTN
jgi:sortase A